MLRKDRMFTIALPRLPSRIMLERTGQLEARVSVLDEEFDEAALEVGGWAGGWVSRWVGGRGMRQRAG